MILRYMKIHLVKFMVIHLYITLFMKLRVILCSFQGKKEKMKIVIPMIVSILTNDNTVATFYTISHITNSSQSIATV